MLGLLPKTLDVNGKQFHIDPDFRNVLRIISAFDDKELTDAEKALVCLRRLYTDFGSVSPDDYEAAYKAALVFISYTTKSGKRSPEVVSWEHDEALIFPAINTVAGKEVRETEYLHWWTFLGYYTSIDPESLFSHVVSIRLKMARREKLDSSERKFYEANPELCKYGEAKDRKTDALEYLEALHRELMEGG